jgi:hypothetical protein
VTEDLGMRVKCEPRSIAVVAPDRGSRLDDPVDQHAKRLLELEAEASRLRAALPDLIVDVSPNEDAPSQNRLHIQFLGGEPIPSVEELVNEAREKFPKRHKNEIHPLEAAAGLGIPAHEYDRYNGEVDEYLEALPKYVERFIEVQEGLKRAFHFTLWLHNRGGKPADDIDVHVLFPEGLHLVQHAVTGKLAPPKEPQPPTGPLQRVLKAQDEVWQMRPVLGLRNTSEEGRTRFRVRIEEGHRIEARLSGLKHGYQYPLGTFTVFFDTPDTARSFHAEWVATAGNRPQEQKGQIHFIASR